MGEDADARRLLRIAAPPGWEDELIALAALEGFGDCVARRDFPPGVVDGGPQAPELGSELLLRVPAGAAARVGSWLARCRTAWGLPAESLRCVADEPAADEPDPERAWRARWRPFRCAGFVVRAEFHDPARLPSKPGDVPLRITAGSAFGTGGHPTTRMALAAVRRVSRVRAPDRWLDVGTGSGILATAALLLGARSAAGMDPDPASPPQALRTAALNGVGGRLTVWRGGLESARGDWPAVAANLVADLPRDAAPDLAALLTPGGLLHAGGIAESGWERAAAGLRRAGLILREHRRRGRWIASLWERLR